MEPSAGDVDGLVTLQERMVNLINQLNMPLVESTSRAWDNHLMSTWSQLEVPFPNASLNLGRFRKPQLLHRRTFLWKRFSASLTINEWTFLKRLSV